MSKFFNYKGKAYRVSILGYGRYEVTSTYRNKVCSFFTHDSELYDYCDDETNKKRMWMYQRHCAKEIRYTYNYCVKNTEVKCL